MVIVVFVVMEVGRFAVRHFVVIRLLPQSVRIVIVVGSVGSVVLKPPLEGRWLRSNRRGDRTRVNFV